MDPSEFVTVNDIAVTTGKGRLLMNFIVFLQYFADRDIFCAGRVAEEDLHRVAAAAGGTVQTTVNNIIDEVNFSPLLLSMMISIAS